MLSIIRNTVNLRELNRWYKVCEPTLQRHYHNSPGTMMLRNHGVVPDMLKKKPCNELEVSYGNENAVLQGNILCPFDVKARPRKIHYPFEYSKYYTLVLADLDAPCRENPEDAQWLHWLVVNIPACRIGSGETIVGYVGAAPPRGTGLHRYVFTLLEQPKRLKFCERPINNRKADGRENFCLEELKTKYDLKVFAANFYRAQWDCYVPKIYKQMCVEEPRYDC